MSSRWLAVVFALAAAGTLPAEVLPLSGAGDVRIRSALYSPDQVYRLYAFVGFDIRLEFAPEERFVAIDAGDLEAITYAARGNVVSLKPRVPGAQMNLAITTTRHTYYFEYTALRGSPDDAATAAMYVVRFRYPPETDTERMQARSAEQVNTALDEASGQRRRNQDYWYCGAPSLKPSGAWDDGVHTYLSFPARAELPALFVGNADGSESLVNFTVAGGEVVIHRVAPRFIVRRGRLAGCIVNKGFAGSAVRLETGTVSPEVEREAKVPQP